MVSYEKPSEKPTIGTFIGFDHIQYWVGNAHQAADWYAQRFGMRRVAYAGLETGNRDVVSYVLQNKRIFFVFSSPLEPNNLQFSNFLSKHGDGIKDIAFTVDDATAIFNEAVKRGAKPIRQPQEHKDENGSVILASIQTYGDTCHTFIQRDKYQGIFLPGFKPLSEQESEEDALEQTLEKVAGVPSLQIIDHVAGAQGLNEMDGITKWYEKVLDFHRFFSIDDENMQTEYSSLNLIVMANYEETIKLPIMEPALGKRKSQIQEYVDYYAGPGVQHIALRTNDIIATVQSMRTRGMKFMKVPSVYYSHLRKRLATSPVEVKEDIDRLEQLGILLDFDDKGYLLQIFTKNSQDRPTLFYEVIQRWNHDGFGAGNFKALFVAVEADQAARGNL